MIDRRDFSADANAPACWAAKGSPSLTESLRKIAKRPKERRRLVAGQPRPSGWCAILGQSFTTLLDSLAQPAGRRDVRPSLSFTSRSNKGFQRIKPQGGAAFSCPATSAATHASTHQPSGLRRVSLQLTDFPLPQLSYTLPLLTILLFLTTLITSAQETIHLRDGRSQSGTILSQADKGLAFEFTNQTTGKKVQMNILWENIERIEFPSSLLLIDALSKPTRTELRIYAQLWQELEPWLSRPDSRTAELGLVYAKRLATSGEQMAPEQALDLYHLIAEHAWSAQHRTTAAREKFTLMLDMGQQRKALKELEALAQTYDDPGYVIEAKYVLASRAFEKLKTLEAENPRWQLDDDIRPVRHQTFNEAIDQALYPLLFHGHLADPTARGLLLISEVYEYVEDYPKAKTYAGDVIRLYSESSYEPAAQEQSKSLSKK